MELEIVSDKDKYDALLKEISLEQLAKIFVVSEVTLKPVDGEVLNVSKVRVIHHPGHFCERCWNYESDAVKQDDGTYLCKRCQKVVGK